MSRTINGISVTEVLSKLASKRKPDDKLQNKYPYYKIDTFYEVWNSAVGVDHYNVSYPIENYVQVSSGQELVSCKCRIEILDDNYEVVISKEAWGGKEIQYATTSGKTDGLKNIPGNAAQAAFKEASKMFGIFGLRPTNETDVEISEQAPTGDIPTKSSVTEKDATYRLITICKAEVVRTDKNTSKPVYRFQTTDEAGSRYDVLFYPNNYKDSEDTVSQMVSLSERQQLAVTIAADALPPRNGIPQLIFKRLA